MGKSAEEAQNLFEKMAANSYQWVNIRGAQRRGSSMSISDHEALNALSAQMQDVLAFLKNKATLSSQNVIACCTVWRTT